MRLKTIDFLRGIAVLLVLLRHIYFEPFLVGLGWLGVDLFFVLSGFLVSNLLFSEYRKLGTVRPVRFLIRRGLKIYPLYYLMIFILFGILAYREPSFLDIYKKRLINELIFVQNYRYADTLVGHTWSLAVEEHFYFALALIIFGLFKLKLLEKTALFNGLSLLIWGLALNMRYNVVSQYPQFSYDQFLIPTHLRMDTLWVGVWLSYYFNFHKDWFLRVFSRGGWVSLGLVAFLIVGSYGLGNRFLATAGLTMIAFSFGGTLAGLLAHPNGDNLLNQLFGEKIVKGMAKIGENSYAIYLFHMMIVWFLIPFHAPDEGRFYNTFNGRINFVVLMSLALGIGFLATRYIETPILKWRDKIAP
jgi:peptidoglycan/LPS O-acetylase OafA/YrhL